MPPSGGSRCGLEFSFCSLEFVFGCCYSERRPHLNYFFMPEETKIQNSEGWQAFWLFIFDFFKVFILALAIIIPVRWFLFQPFVVTGDSMLPNFQDGNYLIIDELTYRFREPVRGEVVVMRFPHDPKQFFIKRIVGLPGERVVIRDNEVKIFNAEFSNGLALAESYLPPQVQTSGTFDRKLEEKEYFVLGDNRLSSSDSRIWGSLPRELVVGRVYLRLFPLPKFTIYNENAFETAD